MTVPAPRFRMEIKGGRELERNLLSLKAATAKRKLRQALLKAAEPVAEEMERRAHRLTGATAESVGIEAESGVGPHGVTVNVGPDKARNFIARLNEFGTSRQPARPRYRPAWDATAPGALAIFVKELRQSLVAAGRRLRRQGMR